MPASVVEQTLRDVVPPSGWVLLKTVTMLHCIPGMLASELPR